MIPKNHTIPDFKNFVNLSIFTWSESLDIMIKLIKIIKNGIIIFCIILPIKLIINKIIGWIIPLVAILPVANINVIKSGINIFINATKLVVVS